MSDPLERVRQLHAPDYEGRYCEGCPEDDYGYANWPCPTAEIVYTDAEIAEVHEAVDLADKWQRERRWKRAPQPAYGIASLVQAAYDRVIMDALQAPSIFQAINVNKLAGNQSISLPVYNSINE